MIRQEQREWVQGHLEEIFTAVLTAFFTALMFRVGLGMLFSIVTGLALAYGIRLIAMRRAVSAVRRRVPWLREPTTPA